MLAFFVGDRRSHGWLLTRHELRHSVLPGRSVLDELVRAAIAQQRSPLKSPAANAFTPLLDTLLQGVTAKRLLVLPDGPLHGMPFATIPIPLGAPRELLIDRCVIAGAPSLAVALHTTPRNSSPDTLVAVISDPVYTPDDRRLTVAASQASRFRGGEGQQRRLARLPYSALEARAVIRAFTGADIIELNGFDATARRVIELPSQQLDVLHFATHAVIREDAPEQSALFLSEFAADGSPLQSDRLTADDITRSGLRADVVVLSGCATGDGRELRGEGVLDSLTGSRPMARTPWWPRCGPSKTHHRALHGRVLHCLSRLGPRGRRAANRAIARPQQVRTHGLGEFRGALQRTALIGRAPPARILTTRIQHCAERLAWLARRRMATSLPGQKPPAIRYKCHDPAISPTCGRIRETFFSAYLRQTRPTKSAVNCGTMPSPLNTYPVAGVRLHVLARSRL